MRVSEIRQAADDFNIPFKAAAWYRIQYLRDLLFQQVADQKRFDAFTGSWTDEMIAIETRMMDLNKLVATGRELMSLTKLVNGIPERKAAITDDMIDAARNVQITSVIDFDRAGKALAFCHEDRTPSLHFDRKHNRAHCFPCSKSFNAIDVLIERDGLTFSAAVKQLIP